MGQPPYQPDQPQWQQPPPQQPQWQQPPPQQPQWQQPPPPQPQWQQPPPQQQWEQPAPQWQPPPAPVIPGPGLGTHLKRAFDWNLASLQATPREQQQLDAAGVEPRLHGLYVWRRSTLLVALPVLLLSVVLNFVQAGQTETDGLTGFGKLLNWLPAIALLFIPIGVAAVLTRWTEMRHSSRRLLICWVISIVIPLFVALMPLDFVVDLDSARQSCRLDPACNIQNLESEIFGLRLIKAINYALVLLPVVLSIPGGVLKGAGRIKSLFPSASTPGWFLVAVAPFYSLFMIVVFVLLDQVVGNGVLLIGVALLAFTPWLFVIHRRVYGRPLSVAEAPHELARASRWGGWLTLIGLAFVVIFALTAKVGELDVIGSDDDKAVFTFVQMLRTVGEVLSRGLVTAVVFSTIFLYVVYAEWRMMREMQNEVRNEHHAQVSALERYMVSRAAPFDPAEWQAPPDQATWGGPPTT